MSSVLTTLPIVDGGAAPRSVVAYDESGAGSGPFVFGSKEVKGDLDGQDWSYVAAASGLVNTPTAVTIKAAPGAGLRNYITSLQIMAEALGAATEFAIRDGSGGSALWRIKIGTSGLGLTTIRLESPIKASANTLLEIVTLTASVTGAVYFNAQGYVAP